MVVLSAVFLITRMAQPVWIPDLSGYHYKFLYIKDLYWELFAKIRWNDISFDKNLKKSEMDLHKKRYHKWLWLACFLIKKGTTSNVEMMKFNRKNHCQKFIEEYSALLGEQYLLDSLLLYYRNKKLDLKDGFTIF